MPHVIRLIACGLFLTACGGLGLVDPASQTPVSPARGSPTVTAPSVPAPSDPGRPAAPDFSLELGDGSTFTLSEGAKPVYMVFWAEW